jgi:rare lipoprotein A
MTVMDCKRARMLVPILAALLLLLGGCGTKSWRSGGVVGSKPYTIRGKTYYPLQSARGFVEEGIASWYGPGFHGKRTANGEIYNMNAMTAAHKILPLGTMVRVINKNNGRSLVLRINDRGPFVDDRVIDLSRAAAEKLDVLAKGTAPVRIAAMDNASRTPPAAAKGDNQPPKLNTGRGGRFFVQTGSFPQQEDAREMLRQMENLGYKGRCVYADSVKRWRVQLGPAASRDKAEDMKARLTDVAHDAFVVIDE